MSARTHVLVTLAVCAGALLAAGSPASASVTCSNAGGTLTIAHPDGIDDVTVRVTAGTIAVLDDGAPLACAGVVPTTSNIGTLAYSHTGGIADVIFEEPDRLAPGNGLELSLPEINVTLTETMGILSDVILRDTDGLGDSLVIGTGGINFNGDADADIVGSGFSTNFVFEGGTGADLFDARGGTAPAPARRSAAGSPSGVAMATTSSSAAPTSTRSRATAATTRSTAAPISTGSTAVLVTTRSRAAPTGTRSTTRHRQRP